nr:HAD-IA family hydrolase [Candidatus Omnitrophota bacterium]
MTSNRYDAIFCDLGNVLINFDHRIAVKKILRLTPKNEQDIYQLFFDSSLTKDYEEGKISSMEFFKKVKDSLELEIDYNKFLPIWNDIFFEAPLNKKMQNFLKIVKGKYKLVMISNINETHYEFLKKKMSIFGEFNKLILSYEIGFRKPAREIYNAALESVNTAPSKAFYVDDRADLIEAALGFGIKGITFDGKETFKKIATELL